MRVDEHEGAVESETPTDHPKQGNPNATAIDPALNDEGLPEDCDKIAEDVIGANLDETQG
jgi:hypothetical protein